LTETHSDLLAMAGLAIALLWWPPNLSHAGPPLIADDPNTVGPGVVQPIFAVSTFRQGNETLVRAPIADITIGLVDSLDATVVASLASVDDTAGNTRWTLSGLFAVGAKWQFLRRDRGSLAFSPALILDTKVARKPGGLLPIQGELHVGHVNSVIGFDLGYVPMRREADQWYAALYASWAATARLNVLGELWVMSFGATRAAQLGSPLGTDLGTSLGIDYGIIGKRLRLLASLGTGIVSVGTSRVDVRAYLGTQHTFGTRRDRWRSTDRAQAFSRSTTERPGQGSGFGR
jgi:hypothetical protein